MTSTIRAEDYGTYYGHWRNDVIHFSLVVPADKGLTRVELYRRPLYISAESDGILGNIRDPNQNITAENFMDSAVYVTEWGPNRPVPIGPNAIGNRVWYDANQNGIDDNGEQGIAGVKVGIWGDPDGDGDPTIWMGFVTTDDDGYYRFTGLESGAYKVFVWQVDNWKEGGPLYGMIPTPTFTDADNDIDGDNNGRGNPGGDLFSGIIILTEDGEPLNDGDPEDAWFNLDPAGNMTLDFGFYCPDTCFDFDGDGFSVDIDCDDNNATINPGKTEIIYNGIDDDCDSTTLDDECNPATLDDDQDRDGYGIADDCDDNDGNVNPSIIEIIYNGIDDDCDPTTLDDDIDGDGYGIADDCDDNDASVNPLAWDIANNDIDENCDGIDNTSTSTHELDGVETVIFPNPVIDKLLIQSNLKDLTYELYNVHGKLLSNGVLEGRNISFKGYQSGLYLLVLINNETNNRISERIIKN